LTPKPVALPLLVSLKNHKEQKKFIKKTKQNKQKKAKWKQVHNLEIANLVFRVMTITFSQVFQSSEWCFK